MTPTVRPPRRPEGRDDVRRPPRVQLERGALVEQRVDDGVDVVRALDVLGQQRAEVDVGHRGDVERALRAEQRGELRRRRRAPGARSPTRRARRRERRPCGSGPPRRSMSTSSPVTERTTSGPVTNTRPVGAEDDDVGERRAVGRTAGGRAEHDRDLRDPARGAGHDREDQADGVQAARRPRAGGRRRSARGPTTGTPSAQRALVGLDDDLAAADRPSRRPGWWRRCRRRPTGVPCAVPARGEHAAVVVGGDAAPSSRRRGTPRGARAGRAGRGR